MCSVHVCTMHKSFYDYQCFIQDSSWEGGGEGIPGHPPLNETLDYISGYHMHCIIHVYWKNGL